MNIKKVLKGTFLVVLALLVGAIFWQIKSELPHSVNQPKKVVDDKKSKPAPVLEKTAEPAKSKKADSKSAKADWLKSETPIEFPILMYHHIADVVDGNTLFVPADEFEMEMMALKNAGYYTLTPEEAYRVLTTNEKPAEKIVWVTFDDGYKNAYDTAMPILSRLEMTGSFFIITGMRDDEDKMPDEMLLKMKQNSLISLESHTVNHPDLEYLTNDQADSELRDSKQELDRLLKQKTSVICYPAGRYNNETAELAENAGYKLGLTTNPGLASSRNGLFALNRVRVAYGHSEATFMALIGDK
ncbi:deacetylase [Lactococcus hodotermopsidis]|uniref:Deacetylase n=1 Tax=Pseudolactococcus hodotermopsidis TaxID=2709157 RepID=A0A6A0BBK9_9LACT|nr:polysaccharide deacetylase family protein [Lactococcus hodotermopsidis]GFH41851.1 deacetylase [Lactococcus hodotermopsidis]